MRIFAPVVIIWELRELGGGIGASNCLRLWHMKDLWNLEEKRPDCLGVSCRIDMQRLSLVHDIEHFSLRHRRFLSDHVAQKIDIHNEAIRPRWEMHFNPCCGFIRRLKTEPSKLDGGVFAVGFDLVDLAL